MASCLTRRNRTHGAGTEPAQPMRAPLIAHHSHVALARSRGTGSRGSARNRRRGSPFAALSDAYKPSRVILSPSSGRDGGEVVALRSLKRAWPVSLERVTADPRHLQQQQQQQQDRSLVPIASLPSPPPPPCAAVHQEGQNAVMQGREEKVAEKEEVVGGSVSVVAVVAATGRDDHGSSSTDTDTRPAQHRMRRRVTWACEVETVVEVARTASADIFSPDLHSLQIAKQLAVLVDEPELARAADAVILVRRQASVAIRTLTSRHGWNGNLDGLEEASSLWAGRELTYMNETDELVRHLSPRSRRGVAATAAAAADDSGGDLWSLKDAYRTARRRMQDADSD